MSKIFKCSSPSVVNIDTFKGSQMLPNVEVPLGTGSGFVWDDYGHIVTNFHVIRNANPESIAVTVIQPDGERVTVKGTIVGVDEDKDVAVLKLPLKDSGRKTYNWVPVERPHGSFSTQGAENVIPRLPLVVGQVRRSEGAVEATARAKDGWIPPTTYLTTFCSLLTAARSSPADCSGHW